MTGSPHRSLAGLLTLLLGAVACGPSAGEPVGRLLSLPDLDPVARRYVQTHPVLSPRLAGTDPEAAFAALVARVDQENQRRVPGSMDYDLPALLRFVLGSPYRFPLQAEDVLASAVVPYRRALDFLRSKPGGAAWWDVDGGDPTRLRRTVLEGALRRQGVVGPPTEADLQRLFEEVNGFLDLEQTRLQQGQETSADHFLDWNLKTTTLTALPMKIGLVTDALIEELVRQSTLPRDGRLTRALVVGPGVDLANPHLGAAAAVAIYQPFELLDSLHRAGASDLDTIQVDCLDLNDRLLDVLRAARQPGAVPMVLSLYWFAGPHRFHFAGVEEYVRGLFSSMPGVLRGAPRAAHSQDAILRALAEVRTFWGPKLERGGLPPDEEAHLQRILQRIEAEARLMVVPAELPETVQQAVAPRTGDVVTHAFAPDNSYDLVLITNVLNYFPEVYRDLALLNLRRVTRRGGILLTTENLGQKEGEIELGWRFLLRYQHLDWDPQYAYQCVKAAERSDS